jgi:hypothetical protein
MAKNSTPEKNAPLKVWALPTLELISNGYVATGAVPNVHEVSFSNPTNIPGGAPHWPTWFTDGAGPKANYVS